MGNLKDAFCIYLDIEGVLITKSELDKKGQYYYDMNRHCVEVYCELVSKYNLETVIYTHQMGVMSMYEQEQYIKDNRLNIPYSVMGDYKTNISAELTETINSMYMRRILGDNIQKNRNSFLILTADVGLETDYTFIADPKRGLLTPHLIESLEQKIEAYYE